MSLAEELLADLEDLEDDDGADVISPVNNDNTDKKHEGNFI